MLVFYPELLANMTHSHNCSHKISLQTDVFASRLRLAFKWMVRAFSGYLSTDQLLLLWDRILGYDSLEVVAGKQQ